MKFVVKIAILELKKTAKIDDNKDIIDTNDLTVDVFFK